jgi:choline dehydrogenase-like flavoprotein
MLSGIGDARQLKTHGITVLEDNPNVGRHLADHPTVPLHFQIDSDGTDVPADFMAIQVCLNYTAPGSSFDSDLQISCVGATLRSMLGVSTGMAAELNLRGRLDRAVATAKALRGVSKSALLRQVMRRDDLMLNCFLTREHSKGEMRLQSGDPTELPAINYNYLSQGDDLARARQVVRTGAALLRGEPFRALNAETTLLQERDLDSDAALDRWILAHMGSALHTCCTARMGPDSDPDAVVDQYGRVRGVKGLRVLDLSICPELVSRGPSATAIMIGERGAEFLRDGPGMPV